MIYSYGDIVQGDVNYHGKFQRGYGNIEFTYYNSSIIPQPYGTYPPTSYLYYVSCLSFFFIWLRKFGKKQIVSAVLFTNSTHTKYKDHHTPSIF